MSTCSEHFASALVRASYVDLLKQTHNSSPARSEPPNVLNDPTRCAKEKPYLVRLFKVFPESRQSAVDICYHTCALILPVPCFRSTVLDTLPVKSMARPARKSEANHGRSGLRIYSRPEPVSPLNSSCPFSSPFANPPWNDVHTTLCNPSKTLIILFNAWWHLLRPMCCVSEVTTPNCNFFSFERLS